VKLFASSILACTLLASAIPASAQGVSMLNPLAASYNILTFVYQPPKGDGWRELASAPDSVHLLYAEQTGETINTRADFEAQSFEISTPQKIQLPDVATLCRLSMSQRLQEKKDANLELVATTPPQPVTAAGLPMYEYTLVTKLNDEEIVEHYFVVLAPSKAEYLAAKLVTREKDFRDQAYFKSLMESLVGMKFGTTTSGAQPTPPAASGNTAKAPESN